MPEIHPFRTIKRAMPRGLFWRSLIIIVAPTLILLGISNYIFFVRQYNTMTERMAHGVADDVAFLVTIEETYPPGKTRSALLDAAARNLNYQITVLPGQHLATPLRHTNSFLKSAMEMVFANELGPGYKFSSREVVDYVDLKVQVKDGVLRIMVPRKRVVGSNALIFFAWMVGSSLILISIAIIFLRNQIRPILQLAYVADAFGKGRPVPDFKPYGASEVRSAAQAFLTMRERIERYVQQRTEMLAGVSHDLKTPLTRLKLELAMMEDNPDTRALHDDVVEMERMLDEYLDFARGEGGEDSEMVDIADIVNDAAASAARGRGAGADRLKVEAAPGLKLLVKRHALKRCTTNLIDNALKHGTHVDVTLEKNGRFVEILVDDDGPGIPESRREEAFRPFHRLDEGRNLQKGGVGLGLAIARDIARAHGGDLTLGTSPANGLRAAILLPM